MNNIKNILKNGYILILPILIWNIIFASKLPEAYGPKVFNKNIPFLLIMAENIFRTIIFMMPLLFKIDIFSNISKKGFLFYILGSIIYYSSWLMLIFAPNSLWSKSVFGFTAPAYTPIIWLVGISLMVNSYYFKIKYSKWHYIFPSILFSIIHILHSAIVYLNIY